MTKDIDKYWDKYREIYSFEETLKRYRERQATQFLEGLQVSSPSILEIGFGFTPLFCAPLSYSTYVGVEPGLEPFVQASREAASYPSVEVHHGFLESTIRKISGRHFDAIVATGVLHEVESPRVFLGHLASLMSRGTVCYLNVPNATSLHKLIGKAGGFISHESNLSERGERLGQSNTFNREELENLIRKSVPGSEILDSGAFFLKPFTHDQMQRAMELGVIDEHVISALSEASKFLPELGCELFVTFRKALNGEV